MGGVGLAQVGKSMLYLRRALNVPFSADHVSFTLESGLVGCTPDESESDPEQTWHFQKVQGLSRSC